MGRLLAVLAVLALVATACGSARGSGATPDPDPYDDAPSVVGGQAALIDTTGKSIGTASFRETRQGVRVEVNVNAFGSSLLPGTHGIHIHAAAKCDIPDFMTAGGHFNPAGRQHGLDNPAGPHAGDLENLVLEAGSGGRGTLLFYNPHVSLAPGASNGLFTGAGTAIVVHRAVDDGITDPSGNSGERVACGIIKRIGG